MTYSNLLSSFNLPNLAKKKILPTGLIPIDENLIVRLLEPGNLPLGIIASPLLDQLETLLKRESPAEML